MPAWAGRLDPVTIKMLAAYVHSLGGGENFVEVAEDPAVEVDAAPDTIGPSLYEKHTTVHNKRIDGPSAASSGW
jgi:hypothetical protein